MTANAAISRVRRDLLLSRMLKWAMLSAGVVALLGSGGLWQSLVLLGIGAAWIALTLGSRRGSELLSRIPGLIAAGDFEEAERHVDQAVRSFSLFRTSKLLTLHHLAMLRHAQRRWQESASLANAVLRQKSATLQIAKPASLILADSLLETEDVQGAYFAIMGLYNQRLSLGEALKLLAVQLDYEARIGAWNHMLAGLPVKLQLAELMNANQSAAVHALLALAARKTQQRAWEEWLCRRASLLGDVHQLTTHRPMLRELWA